MVVPRPNVRPPSQPNAQGRSRVPPPPQGVVQPRSQAATEPAPQANVDPSTPGARSRLSSPVPRAVPSESVPPVPGFAARKVKGLSPRNPAEVDPDDRPKPTAGEMVVTKEPSQFDDGPTIAVRPQQLRTPTAVLDAYADDALRAITEYESQLAGELEGERASRLHYEIGRLYETVLGDLDRASEHLDRALVASPQHMPSVVSARRVRLRLGKAQEALELFDREIEVCPDRSRKAALWFGKARVLQDRLDRPDEARDAYDNAASIIQADPALLKALEHADHEKQDWTALSEDLAKTANALQGEPPLRAAVMVERARLHEIHIEQPDRAAELYESALAVDDQAAPEVLPVLSRLHESRQRWRDLVRTLTREAELTGDPQARAAAYYRIGRVHAERLNHLAEAIAALEASVSAVPRGATLQMLASLHARRGDDAAQAATLTELVEHVPSEHERLALLLQLGQLCHERLGDDEAAITALEAARSIAPADPPVLHLLGPIYAKHERWAELVTLYEGEAEEAEEPLRRALAHAQAAELLERIGQGPAATLHHERALALEPDRHDSMRALERLYLQAGEHHKRVALYEQFLDRVDQERRIAYLLEIASIHAGPLHDPETAEQTYHRVLKLRPQHLGAVQALQRVAESAQHWPVLLEALELEASMTDEPAQLVTLWHRAGDVLGLRLGRRPDAIDRYRRALAIDEHHRPSLSSLSRVYTIERRWSDLVAIYERQLEIDTEGPTAAALLQHMGLVHERELSRSDAAAECYRRALEHEPRASAAAQGLARILAKHKQWAELAELRDKQRGQVTDPDDQARLALAAGELYEDRLDDLEQAARSYARAHELRPDDRPATEALRRIRALQVDWAALADELEQEAGQHGDPARAIADLSYAAQIRSERLGDLRGAVVCWHGVLRKDPENLGALLALEPLLRRLDSPESLIELYARQVVVFHDPGAQVTAMHEHIRLLEQHRPDDVDELIELYTTILASRPDDYRALEGLEVLALRSGKPKVLSGVDARLARLAPQAELRAAHQTRRAEAMETGGNPEALQIYREALRLDPRNRGALRGLVRVAELLRDDEALCDAAERRAEIAPDPVSAADAWVQAGQIKAERLSNRDGAIGDFERALAKAPDHAAAAEWLVKVMRELGRHRSLVERLIKAAENATEPERLTALWLEIADLQARELDNPGGAQASLRRLLDDQPECAEAMLALGRLYVADRRTDEAIELLERCLLLDPDAEATHAAHSLLAEAHEQAGRADEAFPHYAAALEARPDDLPLLRRVARLQLDQGHHAAAADAASRLLDMSTGAAERVEALRWVAEAQLGLGKLDEAIDTLADAVAIQGPRSASAKEMIERANSIEHWERYCDALQGYLNERAPAGRARVALFEEIAQIQHERLADDNASLSTLIRGLRDSEGDPGLRMRLAHRLVGVRRHADAIQQLQILLTDEPARGETWRLLAQCHGEQGRPREQLLALHGLAVLDEARPDELEPLQAWRPHTRGIRPGALVPGAWVELQLGGDPQTAVGNLLAAICDGLGKLRPADLSAWGVASRDRIAPRSDHPLRVLVDRLASFFGLEELDVYVHRHQGRGVGIENTSRPSLLMPIWLGELAQPQQVYLLTQALAHIARGTYPVHLMAPRELVLTVTAAIRTAVPGYGGKLAPPEVLDDRARLLLRGVPRRKKKVLESAAQVCATMPIPEPNVLVHWLHQTAGRVAAIVADDIGSVVEVVRRTDKLGAERGVELLVRSPVVVDLMRMWMSEQAMTVRRRIGLVPSAAG